jgi:hypothetical protein
MLHVTSGSKLLPTRPSHRAPPEAGTSKTTGDSFMLYTVLRRPMSILLPPWIGKAHPLDGCIFSLDESAVSSIFRHLL